MRVTPNFARKSDVAVSAPADRSGAHAHAVEWGNPGRGRGRRRDPRRISRARRRLLLVPYRCRRREADWRTGSRYPVWHLLQSEYHTRSGNRHRPLDRRAVSASTPRRRAARRSELFSSVPVSELHRHHRRRRSGDQGLFGHCQVEAFWSEYGAARTVVMSRWSPGRAPGWPVLPYALTATHTGTSYASVAHAPAIVA